jgi:hypothetical protein
MKFLVILISLIFIFFLLCKLFNDPVINSEHFFQGTYCTDCNNKNYNQCMNCFNCGYCIDKQGKGICLPADNVSGPYNKEFCYLWYYGDPFDWMKYKNVKENKQKCSLGNDNSIRALPGPYYSVSPSEIRTNLLVVLYYLP